MLISERRKLVDEKRMQPVRYVPPADLPVFPRQLFLRRWREYAACGDVPLDAMVPDEIVDQKWLKNICIDCPVRKMCLFNGLTNNEEGVWGGTTEEERPALQRNRAYMRNLRQEIAQGQMEQQAALRYPQSLKEFADAAITGRATAIVIYKQGQQPGDIERPPFEDPDRPRDGETVVGYYGRLLQEISEDLRDDVPNTKKASRYFRKSEPKIAEPLRVAGLVEQVDYYYPLRVKQRRLEVAIEQTLVQCETDNTQFPELKVIAEQVGTETNHVMRVINRKRRAYPEYDARFKAVASGRHVMPMTSTSL